MRNHIMAIAALVSAGALGLSAQTPTDTKPRADQATQQTVTVSGCLKAEKDVPGRRPNVAERAGMGEDYVLTNVKMAQGSATSGIGLAAMYQIDGISDAELQKHVNHQVEITGTLSRGDAQGNRGGAAAAGSAAAANADLPSLSGTSLKMVSATCPAEK